MIAPTIPFIESKPLLREIRAPKRLLLGLFALLSVIALSQTGGHALNNLTIGVLTAVGIDLAVATIKNEDWRFPDGGILTGVIVAFLLSPFEPASTVILAVAVGLASKHLLRTRWSNVLNPAAVSLVMAGHFLGAGESWWGALPDLGIAGALLVLALGLYIADRVNKLPMVIVFLATYLGLCTIAAFAGMGSEVAGIFRSPDIHAALFFALFMLDDPPTSPVRHEDQVVYGIIVGTAAYFLLVTIGVVYYLPLALLLGNAWESARRIGISYQRKRGATA